jgi:hypothetical protein
MPDGFGVRGRRVATFRTGTSSGAAVADTDVAELWLARWLAGSNHLGELRQRAASGSYHALHELAEWLAGHERLDELRELVTDHRELLAGWLARQYGMRVRRLLAGNA